MSGTPEGGRKAAITNKKRYTDNFYRQIGKAGGVKSRGGGFQSDKEGKDGLTGRERAIKAGHRGGLASKRRGNGY